MKRKRGQKIIIGMSIMIAFALFGILSAMFRGFEYGVRQEGMENFYIMNADSSHASIPLSYLADIKAIKGIEKITHASWLSGYVYEKSNPISAFAVESDSYLELNPEIQLTPQQKEEWANNPTGAIVGKNLAEKYSWTVGSVIPLQSYLWKADNNTNSWPLTIAAIYELKDKEVQADKVLLHYDYFDSINLLRTEKNLDAGYFIVRFSSNEDENSLASTIDSLFENNKVKTRTVHAEEYLNSFISRFMEIGKLFTLVVSVMLVTLWIVLSNLIFQSALQRKADFKVLHGIGVGVHGIMGLIVAETVILTSLSGGVGLIVSNYAINYIKKMLDGAMPAIALTTELMFSVVSIAVILGLFSCGVTYFWLKRNKLSTL